MKKVLMILLILGLLAGAGVLLFRHFVTNRISDWGGMENPEYSQCLPETFGQSRA